MNTSNYSIVGNLIMSIKSGKEVAELTVNGEVVMRPGMQGAHSKSVQEFMGIIKGEKNETVVVTSTSEAPQVVPLNLTDENSNAKNTEKNTEKFVKIEDIPQSMLPKFDKILGVMSPELVRFIKEHNLSDEQQRKLVQRLEK